MPFALFNRPGFFLRAQSRGLITALHRLPTLSTLQSNWLPTPNQWLSSITLSTWVPSPAQQGATEIYRTSDTPHRQALRHPARTKTLPFCPPHSHTVTPQHLLERSFPTAEGLPSPPRPTPLSPAWRRGRVSQPQLPAPPSARLLVAGFVSSDQIKSDESPCVTCELSLHPGRPRPPRSRAVHGCANSPAGASSSSSQAAVVDCSQQQLLRPLPLHCGPLPVRALQ